MLLMRFQSKRACAHVSTSMHPVSVAPAFSLYFNFFLLIPLAFTKYFKHVDRLSFFFSLLPPRNGTEVHTAALFTPEIS